MVLTKVKEWIRATWVQGSTVLMENGAPAHTSRSTQAWLETNLGVNSSWGKAMWPPSSPDANPMDFSIWAMLVSTICKKEPKNPQDLVDEIEGMWMDVLSPDYVIKTCSSAWERIRQIVDMGGDYIEDMGDGNTIEEAKGNE